MRSFWFLLFFFSIAIGARAQEPLPLTLPAGKPITLDGKMEMPEWADGTLSRSRYRGQEAVLGLKRTGNALAIALSVPTPYAGETFQAALHPPNRIVTVGYFPGEPMPPVLVQKGAARDRLSSPEAPRGVRVRYVFNETSWSLETTIPLRLLEIPRGKREWVRAIFAVGRQPDGDRTTFPPGVERDTAPDLWPALDAPDDFGKPSPEEETEADRRETALLQLLFRLASERDARQAGKSPPFEPLGRASNPKKNRLLADLTRNLEEASERFPNLPIVPFFQAVVSRHRNRPDTALDHLESVRLPFFRQTEAFRRLEAELLAERFQFDAALKAAEGLDELETRLRRLRNGWAEEQAKREAEKDTPILRLETTKGPIRIRLYANTHPKAVAALRDVLDRFEGASAEPVIGGVIARVEPTGDPAAWQPPAEDLKKRPHFRGSFGVTRTGGSIYFSLTHTDWLDDHELNLGHVTEGWSALADLETGDRIESLKMEN